MANCRHKILNRQALFPRKLAVLVRYFLFQILWILPINQVEKHCKSEVLLPICIVNPKCYSRFALF